MVERIRKPEGAQEPRAVALGELVHEAVRAAIERAVQEELTEAIAGAYLAGANTRRIRGALRPLLKAAPLSKSAVSRVVATLKDALETSRKRSLTELEVVYLYLDAFALRVRSGGKVVSVPVLGAVAVLADGAKQLLSLELCGSESHEAWKGFLDDLVGRGLRPPLLVHHRRQPRAAPRGGAVLAQGGGAALRGAQAAQPRAQGAQARARGGR